MPSAIEMIKQDHQKVQQLFRQFDQAASPQEKKQIVDQALVDLETHAKIEEEIFYPAVRQTGGIDLLMNEAREEHHAAKMFVMELARLDPENEHYDAKFHVLREQVTHHIQEEESEMLPQAERLGDQRMNELGSQIEQRKPEFEQEAREMVSGGIRATAKGMMEQAREALGRE